MDTNAALKKRLQSLTRDHFRRTGAVVSRGLLLGVTLYGLITMGTSAASVIAALTLMLEGISKEIAPGIIEDILQRWASSGDDLSLDDVIASIEQLNKEEQAVLSILAERLGVLEATLKEILEAQDAAAQLEAFRILLEEWKEELDPATLHAMMQEILDQMKHLEENEQQIIAKLEAVEDRSHDVTQHLQTQKEQIDSIQQQLIAIMRLMQTLDQRSFEQLRALGNVSDELSLLRQEIKALQVRIQTLQQGVNETKRMLDDLTSHTMQPHTRGHGFDVKTGIIDSIWNELDKELDDEIKNMFN